MGLGRAHASSVHLPQPLAMRAARDGAQQSGDHVEARIPAVTGVDVECGGVDVDGVERPGHREVLGVGVGRASPLSSHPGHRTFPATSSGAWQRTLLNIASSSISLRRPAAQSLPPNRVLESCLGNEVTSAFRKSAIASKNSSYVRTVSGSLIAGTKPGLARPRLP